MQEQALISSSGFRGLAMKEISPGLCMNIGLLLSDQKAGQYCVGQDVRLSSPILSKALIVGLNGAGSDVVDLGLAPTPAVAYYSKGKTGGAMITASHNPPPYNGIKLFDGRGASVPQSSYTSLASRLGKARYADWASIGSTKNGEGLHGYVEHVSSASRIRRKWCVGVDPGNGATVITATVVLAAVGASVSAINLSPDGEFPGRGPEPDGEALSGLSQLVREKGLDLGVAFDGDGDRVALIDEKGNPIPQDLALGFAAAHSVADGGKGTVVVNVDSSAVVDIMVESAGGRVIRTKVGDTYIVEELIRSGSSFGGESCGAWIHPKHSLCPDGVLSCLIFLNLLEESGLKPSEIGRGLPSFHLARIKIPCPSDSKPRIMESVKGMLADSFPGAGITDIDGVRVELPDKTWILVRPSGTEPIIRVTAESASETRSQLLASQVGVSVKRLVGRFK